MQLKRQPIGLAIHAAIHGVIAALLAAPVLPRWWVVIPAVTVLHYVVDAMKVGHGPAGGAVSFAAFLFDQAVHLAILALGVLLSGLPLDARVAYGSPALTRGLYYAIPYVTVTFGGTILLYQIALAFRTRPHPAELVTVRLRLPGSAERALTLTVILFLAPAWWWLGAVSSAVQVGANHRQRGRWVETASGLIFTAAIGVLFR